MSNQLSVLLFIYGIINIFSGLVALVLWSKNKSVEYKYLFYYMLGSITCILIQAITANFNTLAIIAGGSAQFLISLPSAYFIARMNNRPVHIRLYLLTFLFGYLLSLFILIFTDNFFALSFPILFGTAFPYLHTIVINIKRWSIFSFIEKILLLIYVIFFLHMLDFSFLRNKAEFEVIGFSAGLILVFSQLLIGLAVAIESVSRKEKKLLEKIVAKRTRQLATKNEEILLQQNSIKEKNQELLALNDEKNNLIGIVAHDLKSPLNQIEGFLNLLGLQRKSIEDTELIETARTVISRQRNMINKILDTQALESNIAGIETTEVDIIQPVKSLVRDYQKSAMNKNLRLTFESNEIFLLLNTNQEYLMMIVENLISNAIKFSPPNKNILVLIKKVKGIGIDTVRLEVIDEGPGIASHEMSLLFNKFQKLSARPTGGEESTGLGLSIAKKYSEALHGRIWYERNSTGGSTFIVEFDEIRSAASLSV